MTIANRMSPRSRISVWGKVPPDGEGYGHG